MKANLLDEKVKIASSRPKLVMKWTKYHPQRWKLLNENTKISKSRCLHQGYSVQTIQIPDQKDRDQAK